MNTLAQVSVPVWVCKSRSWNAHFVQWKSGSDVQRPKLKRTFCSRWRDDGDQAAGMGVQFTVQVVHLPLVWAFDAFASAATGQCGATGPSA